MGALTFVVIQDTATPAVKNVRAALTGPGAKRAMGIGMRREVRGHLRALPPNKQGFPTTGFYQTAAESVTAPQVEGNSVSISITQPDFASGSWAAISCRTQGCS